MLHYPLENWLSGMDSNHDKELQRLLCYHYTTGQNKVKVAVRLTPRKEKTNEPGEPWRER
jgi:hypothetical protein